MNRKRKPRVFVHQDVRFGGAPLSQIVQDAGCELAWRPEGTSIRDALEQASPPLDLIVISLTSRSAATLESVAEFRKRDWLAVIPILGVGRLDGSDLDLWQLRALGIAGFIDTGALPEHVRYRIGQVAYMGREGRRFERAPCCLPVEVEVKGERMTAYAVSLSVGGMGLACPGRIEPNTLVRLRFSLEEGKEPISLAGRTVQLREARRDGAEYHVGVFFLEIGDRLRMEIGITVARLLAAWDLIEGTYLANADPTGSSQDPHSR